LDLLTEAAQHHKAKKFLLVSQQDQLRTLCGVLASAVDRVDSVVGGSSDAQLLVAKADIESTLTALEKQMPALAPQSDSKLQFMNDPEQAACVSRLGKVRGESAYPGTTVAQGAGLERVRAGEEASFTITAYDRAGEALGKGGDAIMAEARTDGNERIDVKVMDEEDGTYTAYYRVTTKVPRVEVAVLLDNAHIPGSPFSVRVVHRVEGVFAGMWGSNGNGQGQLAYPAGVAVSDGEVFVSEYGNHRIQVFDKQGQFVRMWGSNGKGQGQLSHPAGVAVCDGEVFVSEYGNNRIQVFNKQGQFVRMWGSNGKGQGQFSYPADVAVSDGEVFVCDSSNHRIQRFR
jgi:hypothetical protein